MKKRSRDENVLKALIRREYYNMNNYRQNVRIMRTLVCRANYEFRKVWEQSSKQLISCESNTVFLNNYRTGYSGFGLKNAAPVHKFSICPSKMSRKIVDAILSRSRPTEIQTERSWTGRPGGKLYGITSSTFLVIDLNTGYIGFEVPLKLPDTVKFKNINWLQTEESVVLSTTLCPKTMPGQQRSHGHGPHNLVKILAVFKIMPVRFICMFEVTRDSFGIDVNDVMMCQGLLVVMHQSQHVFFYNFEQLLQQYQIIPQVLGNSHYSDTPSLTINMKITESPCHLFEIRCEECNVQMGGHPWHYLVSPVGNRGCFKVYSLDGDKMVRNGVMESDKDSIEFDRAVFHADDSSRIVHIGPDEVRVFWLKQESEGCVLSPAFTITLQCSPVQTAAAMTPVTTSSGRKVKRRFSMEEITGIHMCTTIHEVDYEDELDILMVCSTLHQPNALHGTVGLYDNNSGCHLRSVKLEEPWADYSEHNVSLDKDTIIQIVKSTNGKFLCQVYRLFEKCHDKDKPPTHKSRKGAIFKETSKAGSSINQKPSLPLRHTQRRLRPR